MTDQDDAIRAATFPTTVEEFKAITDEIHKAYLSDRSHQYVALIVASVFGELESLRASRPPAPAPTGAALIEIDLVPCDVCGGAVAAINDLRIGGRHRHLNCRLPAPAAAPVAMLSDKCETCGREIQNPTVDDSGCKDCSPQGRFAKTRSKWCRDGDHGWCANRDYEETHCGCGCHAAIRVGQSYAPVALDMSPEDADWLANFDMAPLTDFLDAYDAALNLRRLLTDAHSRLAEALKENARVLAENEMFPDVILSLENDVARLEAALDTEINAHMEMIAENTGLSAEIAALRAQAGATGTVELTKEERERICDDYGMPASAIADDVLAALNRRTRPAASAADEKRDQEEVVGVLWAGGKFCVPCWLRTETFEAIRDMGGDRLARQDTGSCMKCGRDVADVFDAMLRG